MQIFSYQNLKILKANVKKIKIINNKASSKYLFKDYIEINDNHEKALKFVKATKLLDEEIIQVTKGILNNVILHL